MYSRDVHTKWLGWPLCSVVIELNLNSNFWDLILFMYDILQQDYELENNLIVLVKF